MEEIWITQFVILNGVKNLMRSFVALRMTEKKDSGQARMTVRVNY